MVIHKAVRQIFSEVCLTVDLLCDHRSRRTAVSVCEKEAPTGSIWWIVKVSRRTLETPIRTMLFRPVPRPFFICTEVRWFVHVLVFDSSAQQKISCFFLSLKTQNIRVFFNSKTLFACTYEQILNDFICV